MLLYWHLTTQKKKNNNFNNDWKPFVLSNYEQACSTNKLVGVTLFIRGLKGKLQPGLNFRPKCSLQRQIHTFVSFTFCLIRIVCYCVKPRLRSCSIQDQLQKLLVSWTKNYGKIGSRLKNSRRFPLRLMVTDWIVPEYGCTTTVTRQSLRQQHDTNSHRITG